MINKIFGVLLLLLTLTFSGTFSKSTGIVLTDGDGRSYDIDALIADGYHIMVHQTGST